LTGRKKTKTIKIENILQPPNNQCKVPEKKVIAQLLWGMKLESSIYFFNFNLDKSKYLMKKAAFSLLILLNMALGGM